MAFWLSSPEYLSLSPVPFLYLLPPPQPHEPGTPEMRVGEQKERGFQGGWIVWGQGSLYAV